MLYRIVCWLFALSALYLFYIGQVSIGNSCLLGSFFMYFKYKTRQIYHNLKYNMIAIACNVHIEIELDIENILSNEIIKNIVEKRKGDGCFQEVHELWKKQILDTFIKTRNQESHTYKLTYDVVGGALLLENNEIKSDGLIYHEIFLPRTEDDIENVDLIYKPEGVPYCGLLLRVFIKNGVLRLQAGRFGAFSQDVIQEKLFGEKDHSKYIEFITIASFPLIYFPEIIQLPDFNFQNMVFEIDRDYFNSSSGASFSNYKTATKEINNYYKIITYGRSENMISSLRRNMVINKFAKKRDSWLREEGYVCLKHADHSFSYKNDCMTISVANNRYIKQNKILNDMFNWSEYSSFDW